MTGAIPLSPLAFTRIIRPLWEICPSRRKGKAAKAVSTAWTLGLSLVAALPFRLWLGRSIPHGRNEASPN
jgi:hypothetical protein